MTPAPPADVVVAAARWTPEGVAVIDGLDLRFAAGQITALLGPSGCGKSSLLRVVAGLRKLDGGSVSGGADRVGFVFQEPALLPWRTVRENVALPGEFGPIDDVDAVLAEVGLAEHAARLPGALSGGQRMRTSLARALVARPSLLLLDEPFAALDAQNRAEMQRLVLHAHTTRAATVLLVTHDLADAARLADRILVVDGPPLRVVRDVPVLAPRPRGPDALAEIVRRLEAP